MSTEIRPAHVHANVPMVSAADAELLRVPPVTGGCRLPPGHPLTEIADRPEIDRLIEAVHSDRRVHIVSGPPGVGKTTIARAAVLRLRGTDPGRMLWWVSARDRQSLVDGLAALALERSADDAEVSRARESGSRRAMWEILERALAEPAAGPRRVLVTDGADDPASLRSVLDAADLLAARNLLLVVTTRRADAGPDGPIGLLDPTGCADLLRKRLPDGEQARFEDPAVAEAAAEVAERLGRLPIALHVAGTRHGSTLVRHTMRDLARELERLGAPSGPVDDPARHVTAAARLALEAVPATARPAATVVLHLLAALAPGRPFPLAALDVAVRRVVVGESAPAAVWLPLLERGRRTLVHTGLATFGTEGDSQVTTMHPLVAEAVRRLPAPPEVPDPARLAATALDRVTRHLSEHPIDDAALSQWRLVIPHVEHVLAGAGTTGDEVALRAALEAAEQAARHLTELGMYAAAMRLAERALAQAGRFAADDPARLTARLRIGLVRQGRGYYDPLDDRKRPGHPAEDPLTTAYNEIREVAEAEAARSGPVTRDDRLRRIRAEHHLAAILHDRGHLAEAARLFRTVFDERTELLGPDDPRTITTGHRLGRVLHATGQAGKALEVLDGVLAACDRTLDAKHPDTLSVMQSHAYVKQAIGGPDSLRNAERDFTVVFDRRVDVLGENHPNTLVTRHNLAWIEQARGRYVAAERGFREVLEVQLRRSGRDHPHTLATAANLAWDLLQRREFGTARLLFKQVLRIRWDRLGANHPDTQTTRGNIGWLTYEQGAYAEATHRFAKLVADRSATIGPKHPRTLTTQHNLALSLRAQHEYADAIEQFRQVLIAQEELIGEDHESTNSTRYNLAVTYRMHGAENLDRAIELLEDVLDRQLRVFSARHPAVGQTRDELVMAWRQRRRRRDLDRAGDERSPSRMAWALSRHRGELTYDEIPVERGSGDDPLLAAFLDPDIDSYQDPDVLPPVP